MSLLDAATPPAADSATPPADSAAPPAADSATPPADDKGKGLLAGKYKTPQDLEKGYNELNKKYREAVEGVKAPEKYETDFSKVEGLEKLKADDPLLKEMLPTFKALGLPQAKVQTLLKSLYGKIGDMQKSGVLPSPYDQTAELKTLGADAPVIVGKLQSYVNGREDLSKAEKKVFNSLCMTADECKLMYKILGLNPAKKVSTGSGEVNAPPTLAEAKQAWLEYRNANKTKLFDSTIQAEERRLHRAFLLIKNPALAQKA